MHAVRAATRRRLTTIPALFLAALALVALLPVWAPLATVFDLVRGRWRRPTLRLLAFGLCWAWLETAGVAAAFGLWLTRRSSDRAAHYALQRWWAARLMDALGITTAFALGEAVGAPVALRPALRAFLRRGLPI